MAGTQRAPARLSAASESPFRVLQRCSCRVGHGHRPKGVAASVLEGVQKLLLLSPRTSDKALTQQVDSTLFLSCICGELVVLGRFSPAAEDGGLLEAALPLCWYSIVGHGRFFVEWAVQAVAPVTRFPLDVLRT
jgi:hypothetical protein